MCACSLIGDAVIRGPDITAPTLGFLGSTAVSAYEGKTIQAADATQVNFPTNPLVGPPGGSMLTLVNGRLAFDGVAGHYTMVFPRPVYWSHVRKSGQNFEENYPEYGKAYHVGSQAEELQMLQRERR